MQKLCCVCTRQQFSASLDYFVTSSPPYLHQFSTISGGNCIRLTVSSSDSQANQSNQRSIQREAILSEEEDSESEQEQHNLKQGSSPNLKTMSTLIPPTPAANKSAEQHQEPSEQDSFNHLLYNVLRLTSQQVQDLNGWMEHQGIPNVHEVIAQNYRKPHTLEDNLKFITQGKTCYIQSNVMLSLSLMITYIRHRRYSTKTKYFGPFYYIQIDPHDYDEWRIIPSGEEIHFSGPNDEDEHQNLSSDDNQVIQQENVCSEPPEPLSYSLFQSHFQGSSTSNTQKIFLPKPIWEKPSKDQQQMIIDHNRSPPNKSPSLLPHKPTNLSKCTPINLMRALLTQSKLRPPLLSLYW